MAEKYSLIWFQQQLLSLEYVMIYFDQPLKDGKAK